jgi:hypothetical protein
MSKKRKSKTAGEEQESAPLDLTNEELGKTTADPLTQWAEDRHALSVIRQACKSFKRKRNADPAYMRTFLERVFNAAGATRG